jgi:glycosyltransferase involved in cell wall biosynthesis
MKQDAVSTTHLVLIPSFNAGEKLFETTQAALSHWSPVWVVIDGSTDGSELALIELSKTTPELTVLMLPHNQGKGAAVLFGAEKAHEKGFSYVLTMDSDGQHPAQLIDDFMQRSIAAPDAMILGMPQFDDTAPNLRVQGRKISNSWTNLETLWAGVGDSLFGFRVYPIKPLIKIMRGQRWMRRFDFDTEAVVRLCWSGVRPINVNAPVKYLSVAEGGVSHFNYWRDNKLLTWMHTRLCIGFVFRLPMLIWRKFTL